ncbi:hypothetical protein PYJP_07870 [Pyrofollis japonicus]|uniref:DUF5518 domain-containing protein n=1 Tax=Pyrofollis japonicus TaxID=3060460 RepID=UPI00295B1363|nr:DUF5518 domain-containing protein [Pyrofollis japonicus]BEP17435.1 hypothetical protein PYJP_07870 [Pyrofollis japonicus]
MGLVLAIAIGTIIAFVSTPLPLGIFLGYLIAGFLAGYLAGQGPLKGALAGFVSSLIALVAWSLIAISAGAALLGWLGALLGWALSAMLFVIGGCGICVAVIGGALGGAISARKHRATRRVLEQS